jgi:hypothetical protein
MQNRPRRNLLWMDCSAARLQLHWFLLCFLSRLSVRMHPDWILEQVRCLDEGVFSFSDGIQETQPTEPDVHGYSKRGPLQDVLDKHMID